MRHTTKDLENHLGKIDEKERSWFRVVVGAASILGAAHSARDSLYNLVSEMLGDYCSGLSSGQETTLRKALELGESLSGKCLSYCNGRYAEYALELKGNVDKTLNMGRAMLKGDSVEKIISA